MNLSLISVLAVSFGIGIASAVATSAHAADDILVVDVKAETRASIEELLATLAAVQGGEGSLHLADIIKIVALRESSEAVFAAAYPEALTVACDGDAPCAVSGQGATARAEIESDDPDLADVSMGVRSEMAAKFKILEEGSRGVVCDVEGFYFSKSIARKNLKAFKIELTATAGTVTVWLAGANNIPNCED